MIPVPIDTVSDLGDEIRSIIDAAPDGAEIVLAPRAEPYVMASPLVVGEKIVRIRGGGPWLTQASEPCGWPGWRLPQFTRGVVIHGPGIVQDGPYCRGFELQDVALIGDGTGTGLHFTPHETTSAYVKTRNVGVFNFDVGMKLENSLSGTHKGLFVRGCRVGLDVRRAVTDTIFAGTTIESCDQAGLFEGGQMMTFHKMTVQANKAGFLFKPLPLEDGFMFTPKPSEQVTMYEFRSVFFENLPGAHSLEFDSTGGVIEAVNFTNCRDGVEQTMPFTVGDIFIRPITHLSFRNTQFRGTKIIGQDGVWNTQVSPTCVFAELRDLHGVEMNQVAGNWVPKKKGDEATTGGGT